MELFIPLNISCLWVCQIYGTPIVVYITDDFLK